MHGLFNTVPSLILPTGANETKLSSHSHHLFKSYFHGTNNLHLQLLLHNDFECIASMIDQWQRSPMMKRLVIKQRQQWYVKLRCLSWFSNFLMDLYPKDL
jgi:hypothetical protein